MDSIDLLQEKLRSFSLERDWDKFHSPKNLIMALTGEVGELSEIFQWLSEKESKELDKNKKSLVEDELADILLYLIKLSDILDVDLLSVSANKIIKNGEKYPIEKCYGKSDKYNLI